LILVPEGRQLFTTMSVFENLEMGATPKHAQKHKAANLEKIFELFPRLKERRNQRAGTLSGGEQQMLAIARGIMSEPALFMIDEMSLGLSPAMALQLFDTLLRLKKTGLSILLVEQNVQMALSICDYGYVLSQGRIDLEGPSQQLLENDLVKTSYLGM
jgi:branched-chain amino acid transport system ATP-binding protein